MTKHNYENIERLNYYVILLLLIIIIIHISVITTISTMAPSTCTNTTVIRMKYRPYSSHVIIPTITELVTAQSQCVPEMTYSSWIVVVGVTKVLVTSVS